MKTRRTARAPRPGSIARVEGLSYGDLDEHFGYVLRRAQLAGFKTFERATAGIDITPARLAPRERQTLKKLLDKLVG